MTTRKLVASSAKLNISPSTVAHDCHKTDTLLYEELSSGSYLIYVLNYMFHSTLGKKASVL